MKYPFSVYFTQVDKHQFWIAECKILKGCVGQGDTIEEALNELEINEEEWLKTAEEYGIPIPPIPIEEQSYSGKFTVRLSPYVHQMATELAKSQGISLNQYVNDAIVSQNACISTLSFVIPKVKETTVKAINEIQTYFSTVSAKKYQTTSQPYQIGFTERKPSLKIVAAN